MNYDRYALVHLVRNRGMNISQASRLVGLSRKTAYKWLQRYDANPSKPLEDLSTRPHTSPRAIPNDLVKIIVSERDNHNKSGREIHEFLKMKGVTLPSDRTVYRVLRRMNRHRQPLFKRPSAELYDWLLNLLVMQAPVTPTEFEDCNEPNEFTALIDFVLRGTYHERKRAAAVIFSFCGFSPYVTALLLKSDRRTIEKYLEEYEEKGMEVIPNRRNGKLRKHEDPSVKETIFRILHTPPSNYDINRTTWRMGDLNRVLREEGCPVSLEVIRKVIKAAGYRWRKARIVLTSQDPDYEEKLTHVQNILSSLSKDERFFSIDEMGPTAIKKKPGKRLVKPDEHPTVPQVQKSKGWFILTAALELSTNQVTHFYSKKKDTTEMIKLIEILIEKYSTCRKLYLSWDAASWHESNSLLDRIEEINKSNDGKYPLIELAPLPKGAQFLNVIESVFSGLARAVLHNSDYGSVREAKAAIDRYFNERNEHFKANPKRAGKKIWGKERVPSQFCETQNCKDPRFS